MKTAARNFSLHVIQFSFHVDIYTHKWEICNNAFVCRYPEQKCNLNYVVLAT